MDASPKSFLPENFHLKDTYTNRGIAFLFGDSIYEYDIHSANISIMELFNLVDDDTLRSIRKLDKFRRVKKVGIMQREDPEFTGKLKEGFAEVRKMFYAANRLEPNDILAVKKDAIFTRRMCESTTFGPVSFEVKNQYSSFIQLKNIEIYYNSATIDVKGIGDDKLELHKNGMLSFLVNVCKRCETQSTLSVISYVRDFASMYKQRKLPTDYYRTFNSSSVFEELRSGDTYDEYWDKKIDDLDILYNWDNVIIPIILMLF